MNKKENQNNTVILLLVIIIVILSVLCVLFATNTISLNSNNSKAGSTNTTQEQIITRDEALSFLTTAANKVGRISNGYPYCGENMAYDDKDAIYDEYHMSTHNASVDYTSLNDMKSDLKKYMSDEIISKYIDDSLYVEKNNKLYCTVYHKGTIIYDKEHSSYEVKNVTSDTVVATGTISLMNDAGEYSTKNVDIEMKKDNDNWMITKYEVK